MLRLFLPGLGPRRLKMYIYHFFLQISRCILYIYLADFSSQVVSELEWESPLRALCPKVSLEISSTWWSNKLLARASRDKDELSQSLLRPDLRLSREGGVEREGGVVGDEVVVERDGGVGE